MEQEKIGKLIKKIRIDNNLTQKEFADKYGITYQAVSKWERGINMPDIPLIKQICKDYNIAIEELLDGNYKKNNQRKHIIITSIITAFFIMLIIFLINYNQVSNNNFSFKTITSSCKDFKVSGSIAYNNSKSSIYISSIDYCGEDYNLKYSKIECILYEVNDGEEKEINNYTYSKEKKISLKEFFKNVKFKVDNYARICKKYNSKSLYLKVNASNEDSKTTTYKVSLKVNSKCF